MNIWEKRYYACDCATEVILLNKDKEDNWINFAIFSYGHYGDKRMGFWQRLRWCFNLLKTGNPYKDEIILSYETAKQLGEDLITLSKIEEKEKCGTN